MCICNVTKAEDLSLRSMYGKVRRRPRTISPLGKIRFRALSRDLSQDLVPDIPRKHVYITDRMFLAIVLFVRRGPIMIGRQGG